MRTIRLALSVIMVFMSFQGVSYSIGASSFKLSKVGEHVLVKYCEQSGGFKVVDNVIFELSPISNIGKSKFIATNLLTNKRLWEREFDYPQCTYMLAHDGKIFFDNLYIHIDSPNKQAQGAMFCIDQKNGGELWELCNITYQTPVFIQKKMYHSSFKCTSITDRKMIWERKSGGDYHYSNCFVTNNSDSCRDWRFSTEENKNNIPDRLGNGMDDYIFFSSQWDIRPWTTVIACIYCVNAESGKDIWQFKLFDRTSNNTQTNSITDIEGVRNAIFINDKDNVYINKYTGSKDISKRITIYCIQIKTGKKIWETDLAQIDHGCNSYFYSGNDYIVVDTRILDKKTGKLVRTISKSEDSLIIQSKQLDQLIIVNSNSIESIKARTGKRIWENKIFINEGHLSYDSNYRQILEQDNKLFILTRQGLTCINATNGKTLDSWNYRVSPESVFSAGNKLVACKITNAEGNATILLFQY